MSFLAPRAAICCIGGVSEQAPILDEKRALRARMRAWREGLSAAAKAEAAEAVARHGLQFLPPLPGQTVVSAFASLPDEFRVWPLLRRLAGDGFRLALPVMQGKGKPLLFRAWAPGDAMDSGVWSIPEPRADKPALDPDVLIVPLLAFDADGWRLGYGGGFYDRSLRALRARKPVVAVGLGFDEQQIPSVPHADYDERLDWVLTPAGPIRCRS
jgi:5-formyltetrahydrofolate cyclo-ligase